MLKRTIAFITSLTLGICCFAGCGSKDDTQNNSKEEKPMEMRDISAKELVKEMKIGWNLGNTLDSTGAKGLAAETSWGNPETREDVVKLLKDTGFNVLRVPVTWDGHMDDKYTVDKDWMKRVKEVVDYGINNDMYVILNTHHEEWYFPTAENKDGDIEQIKALWEQIADEFKNYDEHLIFEGLNEPRLRNTSNEWTGGTSESQEIVNEYERAFYDTVRNSGGNNPKRHLMITGYAASSNTDPLKAIKLPENDDKLIVSVHAYLPYSFALDKNGTDKFDKEADTFAIDNLFTHLNTIFLSKDIPVIIGEFGALNKQNDEDRIEWVKYYLSKAKENGVPCVWWDNGAFFGSGENFGLMERNEIPASWTSQNIVDAIMETVN